VVGIATVAVNVAAVEVPVCVNFIAGAPLPTVTEKLIGELHEKLAVPVQFV
jgi:hypothetical protein